MDDETAMLIARKKWCASLGGSGAAWPGEKGLDGFSAGYLTALHDVAETTIRAPLPEAEALALLRELNDALKIPGWLQPRVDAVLDRAEEPTGALDTPFLTAGGDPAEPKPDHNRISAICELDGCCMLRDKTGPQQEKS